MLRLALCSGLAIAVSCTALADDPSPDEPIGPQSAPAQTKAPAPAESVTAGAGLKDRASTAAQAPAPSTPSTPSTPPRDPTLISVPSNTLGPGVPLWVRREQEQATARIALAEAEHAEAVAALARVEAQRAADDPNFFSNEGVVVYGPHRPGLYRAVRNRPHVPAPPRRIATDDSAVDGRPLDDDPFDAAQRQFYEAARPRIGGIIEGQLEAQRRFGNNAYPTKIIGIQNGIDNAVIRARRGAPKPQDATPRPAR